LTEHDDVIESLLRGAPRLDLALGPTSARTGPAHSPWASNCKLNLIETLQSCLFLKHSHSHTVPLICNAACHNNNKWTFIFNGC